MTVDGARGAAQPTADGAGVRVVPARSRFGRRGPINIRCHGPMNLRTRVARHWPRGDGSLATPRWSMLAAAGAPAPAAPGGTPDPTRRAGCPMMPADSYWHADVSSLPVHARSAAWVASIGATAGLKADFGSGTVGRRPDRHPVRRRRRRPAEGAGRLRLRRRERPRPVPDPVRRPDRGRRRTPTAIATSSSSTRDAAGSTSCSPPTPAGRRRVARRLRRGLRPALERAAARRLDLGRRRRPADPARPRPLRRGRRRRDRPRDPLHRTRTPKRLRLAGPPPGRQPSTDAEPAADGPVVPPQGRLRRAGLSAEAPGHPPGHEDLRRSSSPTTARPGT